MEKKAAPESESLPERFESLEEAAEFWDRHDVADYDDLTTEVHFDVDLQRRTVLTALEPELAKKVAEVAQRQGISTETLINLWLSEKLTAATSH